MRAVCAMSVLATAITAAGCMTPHGRAVCKQRQADLEARVEDIKQRADKQLVVGTTKDDVERFFAAIGMEPSFSADMKSAQASEHKKGCAPFLLCGDSAIILLEV